MSYFLRVRWDELFDDLEGQLEGELHSEGSDLRLHEERARLQKLSLRTRISSVVRSVGPGGALQLRTVLVSGETVLLWPTTLGRDWLAADLSGSHTGRAPCLLPLSAVAGVLLTLEQSTASLVAESEATSKLIDRVGFTFVLQDLCRRRRPVQLDTRGGVLVGTIDRVARDHLDLAVHPLGTVRRASEVLHYRLVPLWQILLIHLR